MAVAFKCQDHLIHRWKFRAKHGDREHCRRCPLGQSGIFFPLIWKFQKTQTTPKVVSECEAGWSSDIREGRAVSVDRR